MRYFIHSVFLIFSFANIINASSYETLTTQEHLGGSYYKNSDGTQICLLNNQGIYCRQDEIIDDTHPDITSFKVIKGNFAKDYRYVYTGKRTVENISREELFLRDSLQLGDTRYNSDKRYIWETIKGADVDSFEVISPTNQSGYLLSGWSKDKNSLYYNADRVETSGLDLPTIQLVGDGREYIKDTTALYRVTFPELIFTNTGYVQSGSYVLTKIDGIDFQAFEQIEIENSDGYDNKIYTKDKNGVYYKGKLIPNADPVSFYAKEITYVTLGFDRHNVYVHDEAIRNADPETFQAVSQYGASHYFKDKNQGYFINEGHEEFREFKEIIYISGIDYKSFMKNSPRNYFCGDGGERCLSEIEWMTITGCPNYGSLIKDDYHEWCHYGDTIAERISIWYIKGVYILVSLLSIGIIFWGIRKFRRRKIESINNLSTDNSSTLQ